MLTPHPSDCGCACCTCPPPKAAIGSLQSPMRIGIPTSRTASTGSRASRSSVLPGTPTGSWSPGSSDLFDCPRSKPPSSPPPMQSSHALKRQKNMSTKTTQQFWERVLNSDTDRSSAIAPSTGTTSSTWPEQTNLTLSPPDSIFNIIGLSEASLKLICRRILGLGGVESSGVRLVSAKRVWPMRRLAHMLTLKVPARSGGMAISIKSALLSMNFEEELLWNTSSPGWTGIHTTWKSRVLPSRPTSGRSGLLVTSTLPVGTLEKIASTMTL